MRLTRLRSSRSAVIPFILLIAALIFWPTVDGMQRQATSAQSVSWLGPESTSYLTSSGIPVWVPSWLPGPVSGTSPEIYAGGGSYSIYFYSGSSFLFITGVAGGGFPGGSEANLNVELTVNASVAGYPAIHDIGIPEGSETPIYDKVMWIAGGVLYTISGNGLDAGSMALANSSVVLSAPVAPAPEPAAPPVETSPQQPVASDSAPVESSGSNTSTTSSQSSSAVQSSSSAPTATTGILDESEGSVDTGESERTGVADDGTGGAWYTGNIGDIPTDGTAGATPPRIGPDDGTGGAP